MRISLDKLRVLDTVERNNSFASAAEELHRVPSAVTYAIKQLESDLGVSLVNRSGYRFKLTPLGQELLKEGRSLLEQAESLENKIKVSAGLIPSNLSIAYDAALGFDGIQQILGIFFELYPETSVCISAEILNGCRDSLLSGKSHLVIGYLSEPPTESQYHYQTLGDIHFVFAVAPQHPLAQTIIPLTFKEIAHHRIIITPDTAKNIPKAASGYAPERQFLSVSSMESKINAQVAGLGVGFLPLKLAKPYLQKGLLIRKEVDRPKTPGRCYLAWRKDKMTPSLKSIIDLIKKNKEMLIEA